MLRAHTTGRRNRLKTEKSGGTPRPRARKPIATQAPLTVDSPILTPIPSDALGIPCGTLLADPLIGPTIQVHDELVSWRTAFCPDEVWSNPTAIREHVLRSLVERTGSLLGAALLSSYRQIVLDLKQLRLSLVLARTIDQHFEDLLDLTSWESSHLRIAQREHTRFKEVLLFQRFSVITIEDRLYHWRCSSSPQVFTVLKQVKLCWTHLTTVLTRIFQSIASITSTKATASLSGRWTVTTSDLERFGPRLWLNDAIINFYVAKLNQELVADNVVVLPTSFAETHIHNDQLVRPEDAVRYEALTVSHIPLLLPIQTPYLEITDKRNSSLETHNLADSPEWRPLDCGAYRLQYSVYQHP